MPHDKPSPVRIWWAMTRDAHPRLRRLLSSVEHRRLAAYVRQEDARRFLLGVAITRITTAGELDISPIDVRLDRTCPRCNGPHGRVTIPDTALNVSVAHSGKLVGVALSSGFAVGLDVERCTTLADSEAILQYTLTPAEISALTSLPRCRQAADLIATWTRKEALVKCTGDGVTIPFNNIHLTPTHEPPAVIDWVGRQYMASRIKMQDLLPFPGYPATVAAMTRTSFSVREYVGADLLRGLNPNECSAWPRFNARQFRHEARDRSTTGTGAFY